MSDELECCQGDDGHDDGQLPDARWTREAVTLSPGTHTFRVRYRFTPETGTVIEWAGQPEDEGDGSEPYADPDDVGDEDEGEPCTCGESYCTGVWFGPLLGHKTGRPLGILNNAEVSPIERRVAQPPPVVWTDGPPARTLAGTRPFVVQPRQGGKRHALEGYQAERSDAVAAALDADLESYLMRKLAQSLTGQEA